MPKGYSKRYIHFDNNEDMNNFILRYKKLFIPWSVYTSPKIPMHIEEDVSINTPEMRKMADDGYVISGNTIAILITKTSWDFYINRNSIFVKMYKEKDGSFTYHLTKNIDGKKVTIYKFKGYKSEDTNEKN